MTQKPTRVNHPWYTPQVQVVGMTFRNHPEPPGDVEFQWREAKQVQQSLTCLDLGLLITLQRSVHLFVHVCNSRQFDMQVFDLINL